MTNTSMPKRLKTPAVSEITGIPEATLVTWRCRGGGPDYYKVGRSVYYDLADVEEWMAKHKVSVNAIMAA